MALLVERVSDPEASLRLTALETMVSEVRTSTSSMTSVPKPLKFLRPHYSTLKDNYAAAKPGKDKTLLADVLSLLAMTMSEEGTRESLNYKLLGSREDLGSWGTRSRARVPSALAPFLRLSAIPSRGRGPPRHGPMLPHTPAATPARRVRET